MDVYKFGSDYEFKDPVFILGSFESLHIGHYELITLAKKLDKDIVMMIFSEPSFMPNKINGKFMQLEIRLQQLADLGIDNVIVVDFEKVRNMKGQDFLDKLFKKIKPIIVCGEDFKFGSDLLGIEYLKSKYKTYVCPILYIKNHKISTSIIKEQIPLGYVEFANQLLINDYAIKVTLESEYKFVWPDISRLHTGIYASTIEMNNYLYYCVLHVNMNNEQQIKFIDFVPKEHMIINQEYIINIIKEIRLISNQRLDNITQEDLENTKRYFIDKTKEKND
ncbi:FAD synthase [Mycoplasma elephantis]|uniref:FAD synthase n=1 Tax=Mycoplasma elephantis TaxID=114882 RepID=UPI0004884C24|nr:hypothetical protein [Mycoplasma elephantis]